MENIEAARRRALLYVKTILYDFWIVSIFLCSAWENIATSQEKFRIWSLLISNCIGDKLVLDIIHVSKEQRIGQHAHHKKLTVKGHLQRLIPSANQNS